MKMRYIVEFITKDETKKESIMVRNLEDAIEIGKCMAQNQTFTIWKEYEMPINYLSWDALTTVQELCCQYKNGERI
jgi:hypothetical protein